MTLMRTFKDHKSVFAIKAKPHSFVKILLILTLKVILVVSKTQRKISLVKLENILDFVTFPNIILNNPEH